MVRETSINTYNQIVRDGLLSRRRFQVYEVLYEQGPLTGGEVFQILVQQNRGTMASNSNIVTRLGELRDLGVAREIGTKECLITGRNVILWDVTPDLPARMRPEAKESNRDKIKRLEKENLSLREEIAKLRQISLGGQLGLSF